MAQIKQHIRLIRQLRQHKGNWVTLSHDEQKLVGVGATIDEALSQAAKKGEVEPVLIKSLDKNNPFFF